MQDTRITLRVIDRIVYAKPKVVQSSYKEKECNILLSSLHVGLPTIKKSNIHDENCRVEEVENPVQLKRVKMQYLKYKRQYFHKLLLANNHKRSALLNVP